MHVSHGCDAYLVIQWFDLFLPLPLTDLVGISDSEELRCNLHEPFWLNSSDVVTVFASGQHQLVIDQPFRRAVEESGRGMDIHGCSFN
jgi:hypothetical protein